MSELPEEQRSFRGELGRTMFEEGSGQTDVDNLWFLTANPTIEELFKVPVVDKDGNPILTKGKDGNPQAILKAVPPAYEPLFTMTQLIANHLSRTGNITEKEAEQYEIDLEIQMLEIEMMTGKMPVWATSLKMYLSMAIKDAIEAHRMKGLLVKRFEAVVESETKRKKRLGLF